MPGTSGTGETTPNFGRVTVGAGTRGAGALVAGKQKVRSRRGSDR